MANNRLHFAVVPLKNLLISYWRPLYILVESDTSFALLLMMRSIFLQACIQFLLALSVSQHLWSLWPSGSIQIRLLLPPPRRSCNRRCLSVCKICAKTYKRICMEFSGKVDNGRLNKWLNFGIEPGHHLHTRIVIRIRYYCEIGKAATTTVKTLSQAVTNIVSTLNSHIKL